MGGSAALSAKGGGSGNPVVFSVDPASGPGVCTVSGSTVSYAMAGPCVIDANQAGNATYAAAAQVQQTVMVNPTAGTKIRRRFPHFHAAGQPGPRRCMVTVRGHLG